DLGAEDYLTRPYRVFEIQRRVRNVLRATRRDRLGIPESAPPADQHDPVTGAGTPSQLLISLDYEHTRAERYGHPLTCMVVRLDNASGIASASEDGKADRAMALIGAGLRSCIRAVDQLFRLRRDEFCILLPETDGAGAAHVLRRLRRQVESGALWREKIEPVPVVQIGLTSMPDTRVKSGDDLLKRARRALARKD
ncbi:MAG: diguanylate cyclase, partial [Myxococcales bacterium]